MVVAIGGDERAGDGPQGEDAVVDDVEAFGFVAKVVLAAWGLVVVSMVIGRRIWNRLIGTDVENVGRFRVVRGDETAVVGTSWGVAIAPLVAILLGGAGALTGGQKTGRTLIATAHLRTGLHQLTVGGDAHAPARRVAWKCRRGGNNAVGHQAPDQAVLVLEQPGGVCVFERHAEGGFGWQVVGSIVGYGTDFSLLSSEEQWRFLVDHLRENACLLVWDNLEPVAGYPAGAEPLAAEEERDMLARFLQALRGGRSCVVLTSRKPDEAWLGIAYQLVDVQGLAGQDTAPSGAGAARGTVG
jgi:hypothetical protein